MLELPAFLIRKLFEFLEAIPPDYAFRFGPRSESQLCID